MSERGGVYSEQDFDQARDLVHEIVKVIRGHRLYEGSHPTLDGMLDRLSSTWESATAGGPLPLRLADRQILLEEEPVYQTASHRDVVPSLLYDHGVGGFVFRRGPNRDEVRRFASVLAQEPDPSVDYGTLLWEADLKCVQVLFDADAVNAAEDDVELDDIAGRISAMAEEEDTEIPVEEASHGLDQIDSDPELEPDHFVLTDAEQRRVRQTVAADNYMGTVRHALRIVHALAREDLLLDEAVTLEKTVKTLVAAVVRTADLDGALETLYRVHRMRSSDQDLELQVAELTLAHFLEPENLQTLFRGLDRLEHLDARTLGNLLAQLGATAAPEAVQWLMGTHHPQAVAQALRIFGKDAAQVLVPLYREGGEEERDRFGMAFLELGTPEVLSALASDFSLLPERNRVQLLQAVARTNDYALRAVIVGALEDPSEEVRMTSTGALRRADAPRVAVVLNRLFDAKAFDDRTEDEVSDFFEMLARIGDADVARVLADHAVPRGVLGRLRRLTPLQRLSLRALRRMRSPEARDVADQVRQSAPRIVREILDDRFGDL